MPLSEIEASKLFVRTLKEAGHSSMRRFLKTFLEDQSRITNPFTKESIRTGAADLYDVLAETGALNHPKLEDALASLYEDVARSERWSLLTLHDGNWLPTDDESVEFRVRLKGGPDLVSYLHELDSAIETTD